MKTLKKILSVFLSILVIGFVFTACKGNEDKPNNNTNTNNAAVKSIRYLNFKPEIADKYQEVADEYEKETGIKVIVETAANNTYEQTLTAKMATDEAPTIFQINGPKGYINWKDYCAELSGTEIYKHLNDKNMAVTSEGKVYGIPYVVNGKTYFAGNEKLMAEVGVDFKETSLVGTAIYLCSEDEFLGDIVFADVIKTDSKEAVADLKRMGFSKTVMLTGDKENIAKDISEKAGIDAYFARLMPDEKVEKVRELKKKDNAIVLYTGDGINDAPVIAEADLGVAMGAIGADAAIEAADVVIMGDSLSKIPVGRQIAKKTMRIVKENIVFSIFVKVLIIIGCAVGIFDENAMWLAVFGDVGVCLIAVANSLRALHYRAKKRK